LRLELGPLRKNGDEHGSTVTRTPGQLSGAKEMPITYQIDPPRRWLEINVSGAITMDEAAEQMRRMFADPAYNDDLSGIVDCRGMTNVLKVTDLRGLANIQLARPGPSWRSRRAVVVSSPEQYGTARVFMVFAEAGPVEYSVFYNVEAALKWVKE
jgi:hypothetical protein